MGKLADFSLDQLAGAAALILSSVGALMLVMFKSQCLKVNCCYGMIKCVRQPPNLSEEPEPEPEREA